ncbi:unnamed protein product [Urochloa humidicola]
MPALNSCGLSGSMRSAAGGDAAGEGVIPGVNCGETGQLGEPDGRDGDKRMEPKIAVAAATPCTVLTIDTLRCRESCVTSIMEQLHFTIWRSLWIIVESRDLHQHKRHGLMEAPIGNSFSSNIL